jgi:dTMP kinase
MKGIFISFEGIEGTGKSTQAILLSEYLKRKGFRVTKTEEPGGTLISQKIRELLLSLNSGGMAPVTELLLYNAARAQHTTEIIIPALKRGDIVISDRFSDSTVAYQGYGRGLDLKLIDSLDIISTDRLRPDITILLDIDVKTGLNRNRKINKNDRMEQENVTFRVKLINCSDGIETVHKKIVDLVFDLLDKE